MKNLYSIKIKDKQGELSCYYINTEYSMKELGDLVYDGKVNKEPLLIEAIDWRNGKKWNKIVVIENEKISEVEIEPIFSVNLNEMKMIRNKRDWEESLDW